MDNAIDNNIVIGNSALGFLESICSFCQVTYVYKLPLRDMDLSARDGQEEYHQTKNENPRVTQHVVSRERYKWERYR